MCRLSRNSGASTSWITKGLSRPVVGKLYLFYSLSSNISSFWERTVKKYGSSVTTAIWVWRTPNCDSFTLRMGYSDYQWRHFYHWKQDVNVTGKLGSGGVTIVVDCCSWWIVDFWLLLLTHPGRDALRRIALCKGDCTGDLGWKAGDFVDVVRCVVLWKEHDVSAVGFASFLRCTYLLSCDREIPNPGPVLDRDRKWRNARCKTVLRIELKFVLFGAFAKLRKTAIRFMSVRPSARPHRTTWLPLSGFW